jgi:hypothetical protein
LRITLSAQIPLSYIEKTGKILICEIFRPGERLERTAPQHRSVAAGLFIHVEGTEMVVAYS